MNRTFVFGDIHGCYDEMMGLLNDLNATENDVIVSLGDIVDRGPKSVEVYHFFKNTPNAIVLMGNHERKHQRGILSYAQEIVKLQMGDEYPEFIQWVNSLGYYYETPEAIIVHAAFENNVPIQHQKEDVLCGSTSGARYLEKIYPENTYWTDHYSGTKPIVYGHHVVGESPKIVNNTYGIDTGACHGGFLTVLELPGFIFHQYKVSQDYWASEQRRWQLPVVKNKNWEEMGFDEIEKQLSKLSFVEDPEVKEYLEGIAVMLSQREPLLDELKNMLELKAQSLMADAGADFNKTAAALPYRSLLFKARNQQLNLQDLQKSLNTLKKMYQLLRELENK